MRELSASFLSALDERWHVERPIGEGGMATVYLAADRRHDRWVAVKVMHPDLVSEAAARRFAQEIQLTAQLHHPNILPLLDSGLADGSPYYVVPFVESGSLRARLDRDGQLPTDSALQIVADVADALDHAHAHGVVHRDVKPENILLDGGHAVVADFGIAHAVNQAAGDRLTVTGALLGTPAYMSPEQSNPSRIDGRSDLYALACVTYEMLAGHAPFAGQTPQEVLVRHAVDPVPPLRSARPNLPPAVERVIATGLAKSPADRYQTGRAFQQALEAAIRHETAAPQRRRRWWVATAAMVVGITGTSTFLLRSTAHAAFGNRDWIVVADVTGDAADSALTRALRDALTLTLQQSRYVNVEPPDAVAQTLRMMGRPDTAALSQSVAREVALRQQARAVLVPTLTRLDSTYILSARVVSPQSGAPLFTVQERAASRAKVLDALDRVAVGVRTQLGEKLRDAPPVMRLERATTQSLDALAAWTRGNEHFQAGRYSAAQSEYERAIALDSNFAMAHSALGGTLYWLNDRADGDTHFARALALQDRLTDRERLVIQAHAASWRGQTDAAVSLYQQALLRYPDDLGSRYGLGYTLLRGKRCAEALEQYEWLRQHDSTDWGVRVNLATCYSMLERYPQAIAEYRAAFSLRPQTVRTGSNIVQEYVETLLQAGRPASAESLARVQLGSGDVSARARAHRTLAMLSLVRGQGAVARELLRQAIAEDSTTDSPTSLLRDRMYLIRALSDAGKVDSARLLLQPAIEFSRRQPFDPPWLGLLGELAVEVNDAPAARDLAARVVKGAQKGNHGDDHTVHVLQGKIALLDGNAASARDHFALALTARRSSTALFGAARAALAEGRRDEADSLFAAVVSRGPVLDEELPTFFEARLALGRLAAARGETAAARRDFQTILTQWAAGDSDLIVRRAAQQALLTLDGRSPK